MSEWESIKSFLIFIFHLQRKEVQERLSFLPLSSVCRAASLYPRFTPSRFIHIQQSIISLKKKREREREGKQGEIRRLQMEVLFFSSCSYPSAFEPAMWKSAGSTALHSSLPLIKSRQSALNQHAKCHSTL